MSYANGTTHYNLPQTVGTDKRDWFDTNEAFANVDADLNTAYTTANAVAANVSALSDRVSTNEGDITDLKAEDVAINARVSTLGDSVSALSATVRDNKQDLSDAICSVVEGSATAEYNHAVGSYFWYNDTLYITTVAISIGDTIVPNTNCDTVTVGTELVKLSTEIEAITPSQLSYIGYSTGASPYSGDLSGYNELVVVTVPNRDAVNKTFITDTVPVALFSGSGAVQANVILDHNVSSDGTMATRTTVSASGVTVASQGSTTLACGAYIYGR